MQVWQPAVAYISNLLPVIILHPREASQPPSSQPTSGRPGGR